MNNINQIIDELKEQKVSDKEAEELALISKNIANLYELERSEEFKNKFLKNKVFKASENFFSKRVFLSTAFSIFLLLGFVSVVSAQKSLPGETLYPVKIASENIASAINPSFKSEILKRRSEEVKSLSGKNNSTSFHKALEDYEKELSETQKINAENIDETKRNLQDAQRVSLEENKKDIENAIIQTQNKQEEIENRDVKGDSVSPDLNHVNKEEQKLPGNLEER